MLRLTPFLVLALLSCSGGSSSSGAAGAGGAGGGSGASGDSGVDSGGADSGGPLPDNRWTQVAFPTTADVFAVWAETADQIWIGADDGLYRFSEASGFVKIDLGMPASIRDVNADMHLAPYARAAGSSGNQRLVLDYDPQASTWSVFPWAASYGLSATGAPIGRISSAGATFWIAAVDGSIAGVFDPTALFGEPNLYDAKMGDLVSYSADTFAIAGPFSNRAYAGGNRGVFRWGGATSGPDNWKKQTEDFTVRDFVHDPQGVGVWAAGDGIHSYDGTSVWTSASGGSWSSIQAIAGELWVAGDGAIARSTDLATFSTIPFAGSKLHDVSGAAPDDVWAVGPAGAVWRCKGALCGDPASAP
jgi:hypothetical protein